MTDKVSIYSIKSKIKTLLKQKYNYEDKSIFNSLKFDSAFDWSKYAETLSNPSKDASLFEFEDGDTEEEIEEKSFMQILNELVSMDEVKSAIDTDMDEAFSAEELEEYFKEINTLDGDDEDLSFKDIAQFIQDNEINMDNFGLAEQEVPQAAASSGGGYMPQATTYQDATQDPTDAADETVTEDNALDITSENFSAQVAQYTDNLFDLSEMSSDGIAAGGVSEMANISAEDRTRLQDAAVAKEDCKKKLDDIKFDDETQQAAASNYTQAIETQSVAQEQVDAVKIQVDNLTNEITNLDTKITSLSDTIATLESSFVNIPDEQTDENGKVTNKEEIRAAQNRNAQLKAEIASLKKDLETHTEAKTQLEAQKGELEGQISENGNLGAALVAANEQVEAAKAEIDALGEDAQQALADYLEVVAEYQKACSDYNTIKNEIMTKMNEEIKTARNESTTQVTTSNETFAQSRKAEVAEDGSWATKEDGTSYMEDYKLDEATNTYLDLKELADGNVSLEDAPEELKELYGKYLTFKNGEEGTEDDNIELIENVFGSEDNFLKMLAMVKDKEISDENGDKISYIDVLLNPENYKDLEEKIADYRNAQDNSEKTYEENLAQITPENATFAQGLIADLVCTNEMYGQTNALYTLWMTTEGIYSDETGNLVDSTGASVAQEEIAAIEEILTNMNYTDFIGIDNSNGNDWLDEAYGALGISEEVQYATSSGAWISQEQFKDIYNISDKLEEESEEEQEES